MDFIFSWQKFYQEINQPEIDLAKACLYFAQTEYSAMNIQTYLNILDNMAIAAKKYLPKNNYPLKIIQGINKYLFDDLGFIGNQKDYYNPSNSFLNKVIDNKTGIPISLSVVYLEIAKRLEFPMIGIGMPGHFIIRPDFQDVGIYVDVFNQGEIIFEQDCQEKIKQIYPEPIQIQANFLAPVTNKEILGRMLTNLKYIYLNNDKFAKALMMIEGILMLFPENFTERRDRGLLYYSLEEWDKASEDLELYVKMFPHAEDSQAIRQLLEKIK